MGATNFSLITTATSLAGGTAGSNGQGGEFTFTVGGTWTNNDSITLTFTDLVTGLQTQIGAGNVSAIIPNYCFTFSKKVYVLSGPTTYFSEVNIPTSFNNPNGSGNGFVQMSNFYSNPENLIAIAPYQGRLVFFSRTTTQIWIVDANPLNWSLQQTLQNIGTFAPLSVQPLGDLDVMFLSDTGFRSLRARDNTLNAFVNDLGSPIDQLVQTSLEGAGVVNLIPPGSVYKGVVYKPGTNNVNTSILKPNTTYTIVFGPNELQLGNSFGTPASLFAPGTFVFTTPSTQINVDVELLAISTAVGQAVTAIIYEGLPVTINNNQACATVEPATGRYWCYLNGVIYVFSYYPNNKILGWSTYLPTYEFVTPPVLSAAIAGANEVDLMWTVSTGDLSVVYNLYRSTVAIFSPSVTTLIASNLVNNTYADTGLNSTTTYSYFVVAITSLGGNIISNEVTVTTTGAGTGPTGNIVLVATDISSTEIDLSWTAATGAGITYNVYGSTNAGFSPSPTTLLTSGGTGLTYANTGLVPSTTYYYYVIAVNSYGSLTSNQANATTTGSAPSGTFNVSFYLIGSHPSIVHVYWIGPTYNLGVTYAVYRSTTSGFTPGPSTLIASNIPITQLFYNDEPAAFSTYYYVIIATNSFGSLTSPQSSGAFVPA